MSEVTAVQGKDLEISNVFRDSRLICGSFCVVGQSKYKKGSALDFSSHKSFVSKWTTFLQQGCNQASLKSLSALWLHISLIGRQSKGKTWGRMKSNLMLTFPFCILFTYLYSFHISVLFSLCGCLSVYQFIYPTIHPSQVFMQELAANARALFPTLNFEGLTEPRRSSFDPSGRSGFS